jgi:hypothetical protein
MFDSRLSLKAKHPKLGKVELRSVSMLPLRGFGAHSSATETVVRGLSGLIQSSRWLARARRVSPKGCLGLLELSPFRDHLAIRPSNTLAIALSIEGPPVEP